MQVEDAIRNRQRAQVRMRGADLLVVHAMQQLAVLGPQRVVGLNLWWLVEGQIRLLVGLVVSAASRQLWEKVWLEHWLAEEVFSFLLAWKLAIDWDRVAGNALGGLLPTAAALSVPLHEWILLGLEQLLWQQKALQLLWLLPTASVRVPLLPALVRW